MLIFDHLTIDERYMQRCLQLALLGAGAVAPNPMVGAVLVHEGRIIGEGYHQQYGQAHAEVNCINRVAAANRHLIEHSTLYVSLEPCAHFGKTPPCADFIIAQRIPRVVIGCTDSFSKVNGKGIEKLLVAGVQVAYSVLQPAARQLNCRFFTFHELQRPYIILKWAQSLDGKIAFSDYTSIAISNAVTNRLVHRWRSEEAAIMVGTNTALYDNPALTNRLWKGQHPIRILVDRFLKVPPSHQILSDGLRSIVFNLHKQGAEGAVQYVRLQPDQDLLPQVLSCLYQQGIQSLLVEGGSILLQQFIESSMWDEARVITNKSLVIGEGIAAPKLQNQQLMDSAAYLADTIDYYQPVSIAFDE